MEEQDLDEWFTDAREALESAYYKGAEERKDPEHLRQAFEIGLRKLLADYQDRQVRSYAQARRRAALQKPLARYRAWRDERHAAVREWWFRIQTAARTWWFHRKIKRLLRKG